MGRMLNFFLRLQDPRPVSRVYKKSGFLRLWNSGQRQVNMTPFRVRELTLNHYAGLKVDG